MANWNGNALIDSGQKASGLASFVAIGGAALIGIAAPISAAPSVSSSTASALASATADMVIDVTSPGGQSEIRRVVITVDYPTAGAAGLPETVYDSNGWSRSYSANGVRSNLTDGYRFTFHRQPAAGTVGWIDASPTFRVLAEDKAGNETPAVFTPTVTGPVSFGGDTTKPVSTNFSAPSSSTSPATLDVYDASPGLALVVVTVKYKSSADVIVAYDGTTFRGQFAAKSTVTGAGSPSSPLHFSILPERGWQDDVEELFAYAVDAAGNVEDLPGA